MITKEEIEKQLAKRISEKTSHPFMLDILDYTEDGERTVGVDVIGIEADLVKDLVYDFMVEIGLRDIEQMPDVEDGVRFYSLA